MTTQPTCAERLPEQLAGRLADFRSMVGWLGAWSQTDHHDRAATAETRAQEYPLAVEIRRTYTLRLELSTGGPADYITATVEDGELRDAKYHFADWFDHAETILTGLELEAVTAYVRAIVDLDEPELYAEQGG